MMRKYAQHAYTCAPLELVTDTDTGTDTHTHAHPLNVGARNEHEGK